MLGEPRQQRIIGVLTADSPEHPIGHLGVEQGFAPPYLANALDEIASLDLLEHVARRPGQDRGEQRLVVGERCQHQHSDVRPAGADLPARLDAAAIGKEDHDVGLVESDPANGLLDAPGLSYHLEVALGVEKRLEALTDHLVIVDEFDA